MQEFKVPELGENVEQGDVTRVLVKVGDTITHEQPIGGLGSRDQRTRLTRSGWTQTDQRAWPRPRRYSNRPFRKADEDARVSEAIHVAK